MYLTILVACEVSHDSSRENTEPGWNYKILRKGCLGEGLSVFLEMHFFREADNFSNISYVFKYI